MAETTQTKVEETWSEVKQARVEAVEPALNVGLVGVYMRLDTLTIDGQPRGMYIFHEPDNADTVWGIWACGDLDKKMGSVKVGQKTRLTFCGKKQSEKHSERSYNAWKVEVSA